MKQRSIQNYFSKEKDSTIRNISSDSDESDESDINKYLNISNDISYYSDLLKKKEDLKKIAKIVINENSISESWKYFGDLYIGNRKILEKYKFCKICFESTEMVLKR